MRPRTVIPLVLALFTMLVAGCGGSDDERASGSSSSSKPSRADPTAQAAADGPQHIHGLGVQGDTLFIATHTGLWAAADGQTKARRIGSSKQDIMGFSVLSRGRSIGSGHPDPTQSLPPNLGLIESRNRGKTWKNVSLEGQADFHTLESAGARVYGFDGTQGRLMVSPDGGRSWTQRTPPAAIFSLAIDPTVSDRIVTSTERGLFVSANAGKRFRPLARGQQLAGLLAWPAKGRLFLIDASGRVRRSRDGGRRWEPVGSIGGQPTAFGAHGSDLYAALPDATVKRSTDGGRSWTVRTTP